MTNDDVAARLIRRLARAGDKLTVLDVLAMRDARADGATLRVLSVRFGVSIPQVKRVCDGVYFRWLADLPDDELACLRKALHPDPAPLGSDGSRMTQTKAAV